MDDDLYDEFGNYIGPELDDSEDEREVDFPEEDNFLNGDDSAAMELEVAASNNSLEQNKIILHEDKKYYLDAEEVYPGVKTVVLEEDAQKLSEPIIKPIKVKDLSATNTKAFELKSKYTPDFTTTLMNTPSLVRNIAIVGHLQHGKTTFIDTLIQSTLDHELDPLKEYRFTDTRQDEQDRKISIKSSSLSLVLQNIKSKSYLINMIDCPGHVNFSDESTAAFRAADGIVLVVDAIEGVMLGTDRLIRHAIEAHLPIVLLINKVDRLILELKLPPQDAYYKLQHTIEDVNRIIQSCNTSNLFTPKRISPELGNVIFSSSLHEWSFTLESFAMTYSKKYNNSIDIHQFAKRLWGEWYHDESNAKFSKTKPNSNAVRTFIQYILDPLYKIYSQVLGEEPEHLQKVMKKLGIVLRNKEIHMDPKPLLKICLKRYFQNPNGFVEAIVNHIPSPIDNAVSKVSLFYSGDQTSDIAVDMKFCRSKAPLMLNVVKLISNMDGTSKFFALARVFSGTIVKGQTVRVLGESFSVDDEEDLSISEVTGLFISSGRDLVEVNSAIAGNWILLQGIDASIKKTATITDMDLEDIAIFKPLKFDNSSVFKLAIEPLNPAELPKMVEALRCINKSYPLVTTKVEESGEHVIIGTGELYLDCIMHDLRHLYSDMEVKVSDPVVTFCETVVETSSMKCFSETTNKRNKFAMISEPLDKGIAEDIERGKISLSWDKKTIGEYFTTKYDWDLLAARSVWAFGPQDDFGTNLLIDDTLPSEVDKKLLGTVKDSVIQGFRWGCREGPLCDEPIRNVKFKILNALIAPEPIYRGGGQIIPAARKSVYSSFLLASPRIMEPVYQVEIQAPADCVQAIYPVLARRRGHVVQDMPKPGSPFYTVKAYIPVLDRLVKVINMTIVSL